MYGGLQKQRDPIVRSLKSRASLVFEHLISKVAVPQERKHMHPKPYTPLTSKKVAYAAC